MFRYQPATICFAFLVSFSLSCKDAGFKGNSKAIKERPPKKNENVTPKPAQPGISPDAHSGLTPGVVATSPPQTPVPDNQWTPPLQNASECSGPAMVMNIVIVFDRSRSQSMRDLQNMQQGAIGFLQNLNAFQQQKTNLTVNASVVRFSATSEIGQNGWSHVGDAAGLMTVQQDVAWATATTQSDTLYHLGIQNADRLFAHIGASSQQRSQRNFIVFLSDGRTYSTRKVMPAAQSVVSKYAAAFITIGIGIWEEKYLRDMAALRNTYSPSGHVGRYIAADRNVQQVAQAFQTTEALLKSQCQ